jgi:hypothetical protein
MIDTWIDRYIDTYHEVRSGEQRSAPDQPGSDLVGWARHHAASRIVYLLPGHTASTMQHSMYRRLLANACAWVAGQDTSAWCDGPSPGGSGGQERNISTSGSLPSLWA